MGYSPPAPCFNATGLFVTPVPYHVYIVQNSEDRFYIGLSEDVATRVQQHNTGISTWTKYRGPWTLVWTQGPMDLSAARKLENLLKRQKGGLGFFKMTGLRRSSSGS